MFDIVLVRPEIHTNTGSIGRMCVNSGCRLHLIKPLGFMLDDKHLKRAGLDYWDKLDLVIWESLDDFLTQNIKFKDRFFFATTKTNRLYFNTKFQKGDFLFFGAEGSGLPLDLMKIKKENCITIPMSGDGRSLNLATSVGIITYEAIRQNINEFNFRDEICEF
ncbi:tRNA (cytidine(34)-2'-O)-methyltransferase [Campylobacter fetus]|uniref:Putative tRNA (cytidine(34)-2'-O)-methyltransferase n=4 Tax=Campylobacter fetus TaxID=196 RepID=A0A5L4ICY9_CAMFE|nr:tRNA (cytidine(34)-2'-O)-methyltransferase [Campylobacter fetus]OCS23379.1 RNA methyltransferase [Campylobacter fetus subsp. venerealis cfvi97/532]OCS26331.1 RNA methyltransferase [Campylobacter fetus subsp. venerealis cfvB10]OCS30745.1 RNA methyltransferase [Campylobacter fetus subsp. venerealis LMG 6570 = CCUG 33900]OCS43023.1 RNA methyltransferase [Campylobacter fetus subsp. venerealis cfvi02/298]ABK81984.1 tRNA/rRNA methyltransferase [Campylobacter fetus subsp. fetus 82-40]